MVAILRICIAERAASLEYREAENPWEAVEFRSKGSRNYGIDGTKLHNQMGSET